jgi:hypothetical protein
MNRIERPEDLIPGESYWLKGRFSQDKRAATLKGTRLSHGVYFENRIWASVDNPQAFDRWEIWGPIPEPDWNS